MKAMILAAGLGNRLKPLTNNLPKPLVKFNQIPMIEGVILKLLDHGMNEIIVNIHHFPGKIKAFLEDKKYYDGKVKISDETDRLMDTGGGVIKAKNFFKDEESFLVHNVDVYTNLDISSLIREHNNNDALVTIAVKKRPTSRSLLFDDQLVLTGWRHNETGETRILKDAVKVDDYGNSCIQVIRRDFFDLVKERGPVSLTDIYLQIAIHHTIRGFVHNQDYWYDLGRYENFKEAEEFFKLK